MRSTKLQLKECALKVNAGFTLLEVILSIAILLSLTISFAAMLRSSFAIRGSLANDAAVSHRLSSVMDMITRDVEQAFMVATKDQAKKGISRRTKTIFKIDFGTTTDKLYLTTMSYRPVLANASESDEIYVVYEVRDSKDNGDRKDLYRGYFSRIPEDFKEDPPMRLIAPNIKSLKVYAWKGDDWAKDRWDSTRSDWKDKLPPMVRIELEGWARDLPEGTKENQGQADEQTVFLRTVVAIPNGLTTPENNKLASIKWF